VNSKQRKALAAVFTDPVSGGVAWRDIESLLGAVGFQTVEGDGSAVRFVLGKIEARFHRPHPGKEAKRYQVRDARFALMQAGVTP
jgi:hypothetical protein